MNHNIDMNSIKQNKNSIRNKNYINDDYLKNNRNDNFAGKNHFKRYIKKLFDDNHENLSYNENTPLYLSNIAGNNNFINKSININYNDNSSNCTKNNRNKSTNYKINNKFFKKIEKDKDILGLNKSTNIEETKKNKLQSDIRSIKSNYINEDIKIKNFDNNKNLLNKNIKNLNSNQKIKKLKGYNSRQKENSQGRRHNNINNINIIKAKMHNNNKTKKKTGINEKLTKIFKERYSVSLKKNNSKGKESYNKTSGYPGYSISKSKSKSPNSYSQEKGDLYNKDSYNNNIRYYGINKKINQKHIFGINNQFMNQKLRNYNSNNLAGTLNSNLIMINNNLSNNYIVNLNSNNTNNTGNTNASRNNNFAKNINNQKSLATPINKNNNNNNIKMNIGFAANFSNVKRKILTKEKNNKVNNIKVSNINNNSNNNFISNINNLINNIHGINKYYYNSNNVNFSNKLYKIEFSSTHSKEKNYGSMKSSSLNKKHYSSKNNSVKSNKNGVKNHGFINNAFININSIHLNSKSKTKRTPMSLNLKK